jgi:hypothetical protein
MPAKRRPEAIRELEALQQQERKGAGEPALTHEDFLRLLREDIQKELMSARFDSGGLAAVIEGVGDDEEKVDQLVAARLDEWRVDDPGQWSRYETPGHLFGLANICGRIETVFANHDWRLPELPAVGTLTTGQVSAVTQKTSIGATLVLIDNAFFKFCGFMSQLAVFSSYDSQIRGHFSEPTYQLVSDLVATHTVLNTCLYVYPRKTPPEYQTHVANLVDAMILFVISHEYAHISAGDLDAHPFKEIQSDSDLRSKELEADKIGFITAVEATAKTDPTGTGAFGPFLYLVGLDLLSRAAAAYQGCDVPDQSSASPSDYPTPYERAVNLIDWLEASPYVPRLQDQITLASACYGIILSVWDDILPVFRDARQELSAADPALHGPSPRLPEVDTQYVVGTLWSRVLAHLRQT